MKSLIYFAFALLSIVTADDKITKDRVKKICKEGSFEAIKTIPCDHMKADWFEHCLMNKDFKKDAALSEAIKYCPALIPSKKKHFRKLARHLYTYNQLATLRVFLADGRCKMLKSKLRNFFLRDAELNVTNICQQNAAAAGIIPGAPTAKQTSHQAPSDANVPTIEGSIKDWDENKVNENKTLLASISMEQAAELGLTDKACLGLTAEHFSQASVKPEVVASLNVNCFRMIPPAAFSGMTKAQVRVITAWPFARRSQIRAIRPKVIVALPFDQLGIGLQTKKNAERHACFGVTSSQLKAIRKNKKAKKLYSTRCIRSAAPTASKPSYMHLAMAVFVAAFMAF